jgi:hypothetical protein
LSCGSGNYRGQGTRPGARLDAVNTVLARGGDRVCCDAPEFRRAWVVCSDQPYVQGIDDAAPLHPTAAGGLAIALTLQQQLRDAGIRPR